MNRRSEKVNVTSGSVLDKGEITYNSTNSGAKVALFKFATAWITFFLGKGLSRCPILWWVFAYLYLTSLGAPLTLRLDITFRLHDGLGKITRVDTLFRRKMGRILIFCEWVLLECGVARVTTHDFEKLLQLFLPPILSNH